MSLFADIAANADKRFFFLMGETGDEFGLPFGRVPLDHLLLLHLRKQEYERVVFFGGAKNQIRHADYRSARVTASVGQPLGESSRNTRPTRAMRLVSGPLGSSSAGRSDQRGGQQQASSNEANEGQKPSLQFGSVNVEAIRTLDVWMQDNIPTAVVFPDAYDLVRHLDDDAVRLFSSCLNEWARLPGDNSNVAVFVFGVRELQELDQILQKDHRFETLRTHVFDAKGVLRRLCLNGIFSKRETSS